jgi:hypothetical protein
MSTDTPPSIWENEEGPSRKPGSHHWIMLSLLTGLGIAVGFTGYSILPIGGFLSAFWPGMAIQAVGGIWFGMWGAIAGTIFPFIANTMSGVAPIVVTIAYLPANFIQSIGGGWAFRFLKADPCLQDKRSMLVFTFGAILIPNLLGAAWGSTMMRLFGLVTPASQILFFFVWWLGNSIPAWLLGVYILRSVSPIVIKLPSFCKGFWA